MPRPDAEVSDTPDVDSAKIGRIWKNAAWLGAIPILLNMVSVLSAGYIARVLGAEAFGRFSMGTALVALTGPITDFGLRALAGRELSRVGKGATRLLNDLLSLRLFLAVIATVVAWVIALVVTTESGLGPVILATSLTIIPISLAGILSDGLMARDRAKDISGTIFWSGILLTGSSVVAVTVWHSPTALALAYVVGPIVNVILLGRHSRRVHGPSVLRWRPSHWRVLIRRAVPFFRLSILQMVIARVDTVVVGTLFGQAMAGVYAAATSLADRLYVVVDSVASAILPTLVRLRDEPKRVEEMLGRILYPLLAILTAGTLVAIAGSTAAVVMVFGPDYAAGGPVLSAGLLLLPILAIDTMLAEGFLALRKDRVVTDSGVGGQVLTILLLPLLPMVTGMSGARLARVVGMGGSMVYRVVASRKAFRGLWRSEKLMQFLRRVVGVAPAVAVVMVTHYHPVIEVFIAAAGYALWAAIVTRLNGGLPMIREFLQERRTVAPVVPDLGGNMLAGTAVLELAEPGQGTGAPASAVERSTRPLTVSVVIPCYNSAATIGATIESVLRQTVAPVQIIVADDLSSDASVEVARRYPVTVLAASKNIGCGASRNRAAELATGDIIAPLDADDLWAPDHVATLIRLLEEHPSAGVAFTMIQKFDESGPLEPSPIPSWPNEEPFDPYTDLLAYNYITPSTVGIRREFWERAGGFDPEYRSAEDYEFWFRLARQTRFVGERRATVQYRVHSSQMSKNFKPLVDHIWKVRHRELEEIKARADLVHRQILSDTWNESLKAAFAVRSREALASVLSAGSAFPEHRWKIARWKLIERSWPISARLLVAWDWIPIHLRRPIRGARGIVIKPQL
jgi:O-antigen/teichoic acid export membrane protein/glycosyltransferase involved in cell wall biosynthesis